jgi:ABC-type sugar transport system ATPase subunit
MTDRPAVLRCVGLTKYFGAVRALSEVSLEVRAGEVLAIMGDNGAGKSTLIRIISGVERPEAGELWVNGRKTARLTPRRARSLGIETVYQHLALCDNLSGADNVMLGREPVKFSIGPLRFVDYKKAVDDSQRLMAEVGASVPDLTAAVRRLSGGQRQALAIARATVGGASLVMFDEPTAALGIKQTEATLELIRQVAARGVAVVVISHSVRDVMEMANRIITMRLGRVVFDRDIASTTEQDITEAILGISEGNGS